MVGIALPIGNYRHSAQDFVISRQILSIFLFSPSCASSARLSWLKGLRMDRERCDKNGSNIKSLLSSNYSLSIRESMKLSAGAWLLGIHRQINKSVLAKKGRHWREDGISERILEDLVDKFSLVEVDAPLGVQTIAWDAFKLSGTPENRAGDIAVIVKFSYPNGTEKEGVAFLEAKRTYTSSGEFDQLSTEQLERHLTFTHAHRTLLYDYESTEGHFQNLELQYYCAACHKEDFLENHASTLSTEQAISLDDKSRNLLNWSLPLSYILITRYLKGFELDYSPDAVNMAKGFLDLNERGGINFLLVAHVSFDVDLTPEPRQILINSHYQRIEPKQRSNDVDSGYSV